MRKRFPLVAIVAAGLILVASAEEGGLDDSSIKHVLLISIDGMHALDFKNCSHGLAGVNDGKPFCPNLAALSTNGVNYVAANTSKPSDSFPGLMNIVSGATPRLMGVYYDVAYDRTLDGPATATGNGNPAGPCDATKPPTGYTTEYEEGLDINQTLLNGGAPLLTSPVGLQGNPVFGTFLAAAPVVTDAMLESCRQVSLIAGEGAVTRLPGVVIARYRGASAAAARHYFGELWQKLRPALALRAAVPPRIWAT